LATVVSNLDARLDSQRVSAPAVSLRDRRPSLRSIDPRQRTVIFTHDVESITSFLLICFDCVCV
jgi:hypothetical protein